MDRRHENVLRTLSSTLCRAVLARIPFLEHKERTISQQTSYKCLSVSFGPAYEVSVMIAMSLAAFRKTNCCRHPIHTVTSCCRPPFNYPSLLQSPVARRPDAKLNSISCTCVNRGYVTIFMIGHRKSRKKRRAGDASVACAFSRVSGRPQKDNAVDRVRADRCNIGDAVTNRFH